MQIENSLNHKEFKLESGSGFTTVVRAVYVTLSDAGRRSVSSNKTSVAGNQRLTSPVARPPLWLIEFSGAVLSRFTLSRYTIFEEVSPRQPEDSPIPFLKAIVYSRSWVRKPVNSSAGRVTDC